MTKHEIESLIELMKSDDPINKLLALELIKGLDKDGWVLLIKTVIEPLMSNICTLQCHCYIRKHFPLGQSENLIITIDRTYDPIDVRVMINLGKWYTGLAWNIVILTLRLEFSDVCNIINLIDIDDESYQQFSKEINLIC